MIVVGLTGGVSAGKSTVARRLASLGALHVDADEIARSLTGTPGPVATRIEAVFGPTVVTAGGGIDRDRLARVVFGDAGKRRELEKILHPAIRAEVDEARAAAAASGFDGVFVVEAALVVEAGRSDAYDLLLVVEAPHETKLARQVTGGLRDEPAALARLSAQLPAGRKLLEADLIVWNDGDPCALDARAEEVHGYLDRWARGARDGTPRNGGDA